MKQIRKISNVVAEELQAALNAKGITLDESAFEYKVTKLVNAIAEGIGKECDGECDPEDEDIDEEVAVAEVYMATDEIVIGGITVEEGDYVEIDELDDDEVTVTVYDADGEVKAEDVEITYDEVATLEDNSEAVEVAEEDDVEEAVHIKGGKKVKVSAAVEKLKAKLKAKKSGGVNKFTIKNGKIVKKSADQLKADKKRSKVFAKQMKKFAKKRGKSLKKAAKLNAGANCGSKKKKVTEGFDILSGGMTFAVEEGDVLHFEGNTVSVIREGKEVLKGLDISDGFLDNCISEGVIVDMEDGAVSESAAVLTYRNNKGYVLVREGTEIPLGNRIRARAQLLKEGYDFDSKDLDKAVTGALVTL